MTCCSCEIVNFMSFSACCTSPFCDFASRSGPGSVLTWANHRLIANPALLNGFAGVGGADLLAVGCVTTLTFAGVVGVVAVVVDAGAFDVVCTDCVTDGL